MQREWKGRMLHSCWGQCVETAAEEELKNWAGKVPGFQRLILWDTWASEWGGCVRTTNQSGVRRRPGGGITEHKDNEQHQVILKYVWGLSKFHFLNAMIQRLCLPTFHLPPPPTPTDLLYLNMAPAPRNILTVISLCSVIYVLREKGSIMCSFYHSGTFIDTALEIRYLKKTNFSQQCFPHSVMCISC